MDSAQGILARVKEKLHPTYKRCATYMKLVCVGNVVNIFSQNPYKIPLITAVNSSYICTNKFIFMYIMFILIVVFMLIGVSLLHSSETISYYHYIE